MSLALRTAGLSLVYHAHSALKLRILQLQMLPKERLYGLKLASQVRWIYHAHFVNLIQYYRCKHTVYCMYHGLPD